MKTHLSLKPRDPSLVIRDPRTNLKLPPGGMRVPNSKYWRNRLSDGDVIADDTKVSKAPKSAEKAKKEG